MNPEASKYYSCRNRAGVRESVVSKTPGESTLASATCSAALDALLKKYPSNGRRMREKREYLEHQMADWRARGLVQYGGNSWADVLMPPNDQAERSAGER